MRTTTLFSLSLFVIGAFACGGATSADIGGGDAAASDAAVDAKLGDGGCVEAVEGAACTPGDVACGQEGNACCIGYVWQCDATTRTWQKLGLGCACPPPPPDAGDAGDSGVTKNDGGPWSCGSGAQLTSCKADQYCQDHPPGIVGPDGSTFPDAYNCLGFPPECASSQDCKCVVASLKNNPGCMVASCDEVDGHVEVHCIGE